METFLGLPHAVLGDVGKDQIVLMSAAEATPYEAGKSSHCADAPHAIRETSNRHAGWHDHYDFDTDAPLVEQVGAEIVDIGALDVSPDRPADNRACIAEAVGTVLGAGALPVVIGGDDSVPIPVLSAYEQSGPIWIIQVDAHIDWRDERFGERFGWSSPMRRGSEMPWVEGMVQFGIRGVGSATHEEVETARNWGSHLITARSIHRDGMAAGLQKIPKGAKCVVSLDCDGLEPAIMPGVLARVPGGLTYWHMVELFEHLGRHNQLIGTCLVELAPWRDESGLSTLTGIRLLTLAIKAMQQGR